MVYMFVEAEIGCWRDHNLINSWCSDERLSFRLTWSLSMARAIRNVSSTSAIAKSCHHQLMTSMRSALILSVFALVVRMRFTLEVDFRVQLRLKAVWLICPSLTVLVKACSSLQLLSWNLWLALALLLMLCQHKVFKLVVESVRPNKHPPQNFVMDTVSTRKAWMFWNRHLMCIVFEVFSTPNI